MRKTLSALVAAAAVVAFAAPALAECAGHSVQSTSTPLTTASADQATKPVQQTQVPTSK
jgi:hypothetical protein